MEYNVKAGDRLQIRHGPFLTDALVVEITDRGAIIDYTGKVTLVGYTNVEPAPDGTQLTETPTQGFIGRAHLATRPVPGIYVWAADDEQPAPAGTRVSWG
jgi:hypothetical protein